MRKHRPDRAIWPTLIAIATLSAVAQLLDGSFTATPELQAIPESLFLGVQVLLAGGLLFIIRRRLGNEPFSVLTDGLIVALGAWFLIWIAFLQPVSQLTDQTLLVTVLGATTLGISAIVLFSLATLLFGDEARSPSVWLVAGAIAFTLLGDFMYSAVDSGRADFSQVHASSAYILCLFFASAAFVHPSISTLTAHGPVPQQRPLLGRLIVTTAALTIPVLVLALTDPADNSDRAVRAISIFVLTAAVTARVIHAVRANAQTQRELIFSAETDALTGLPNRPLMLTHVSNALIGAWSESRQPTVLFVFVHNSGRSQMAAGFMTSISGGKVRVLSAGSAPKETINPIAIEAMAELGIDIAHEVPKILTTESVQESDVVITMGCGDTCPFFPGKRYEDWVLEDPAGQGIEPVRIIRDEIKRRVTELLAEII